MIENATLYNPNINKVSTAGVERHFPAMFFTSRIVLILCVSIAFEVHQGKNFSEYIHDM